VPEIFISYRRDDSAGYAGRLRESLEERFGEGRVFRDVDTLQPGQDFVLAIEERVRACSVFLALIGGEWLDAQDRDGRRRLDQPDDYVRREIAAALHRSDLTVIPVLTEGVAMPSSTDLPQELHGFARRHAVSLRDESWQSDVDRLAAALTNAMGTPSPGRADAATRPQRISRMSPALWIALIAMAAVIGVIGVLRNSGGQDVDMTGAGDPRPSGLTTDDGARDDGTNAQREGTAARMARAMRIDLPRLSEIVLGDEVYTILWASVTPRGPINRLRLRIRFINDGRVDTNFWTRAFALAVGDQILTPVDGPERIVPFATIDHDAVTFDVPGHADRAVLRVTRNDETAELPLDLTPVGYEEANDTADAGDADSRASRTTLPVPVPDTLLTGDLGMTLTNAVMRRFVNRLRVAFAFRLENTTGVADTVTEASYRLVAGSDLLTPVDDPAALIRPRSTRFVNVLFEVPPGTARVILRVRHKDQPPVERTIDLGLGVQRDQE